MRLQVQQRFQPHGAMDELYPPVPVDCRADIFPDSVAHFALGHDVQVAVESYEISTDQSTRINPNAAEKFAVKLRRARVMSDTQRHRHSFCFPVALK